MKASIIVPAFNEATHIKQCIESLLKNTYEEKEIIVVNDGSTDNTDQILNNFDSIITINTSRKGRVEAIKEGAKNATGDIILKIDADSIAPPDWIQRMVDHFNDPEVIMVGGSIKNSGKKGMLSGGLNCLDEIYHNKLRRWFSACRLMGANWAVRAELLREEILYDNVTIDETILRNIMKIHKGKVIYDRRTYVSINSPHNLQELWQRKYIWGARAVKEQLYRIGKFWYRPLYYLLLVLSILFFSTLLGKIMFIIVLLPLIALGVLSMTINPSVSLLTPVVFLISEFAYICGYLECLIRKNIKSNYYGNYTSSAQSKF